MFQIMFHIIFLHYRVFRWNLFQNVPKAVGQDMCVLPECVAQNVCVKNEPITNFCLGALCLPNKVWLIGTPFIHNKIVDIGKMYVILKNFCCCCKFVFKHVEKVTKKNLKIIPQLSILVI